MGYSIKIKLFYGLKINTKYIINRQFLNIIENQTKILLEEYKDDKYKDDKDLEKLKKFFEQNSFGQECVYDFVDLPNENNEIQVFSYCPSNRLSWNTLTNVPNFDFFIYHSNSVVEYEYYGTYGDGEPNIDTILVNDEIKEKCLEKAKQIVGSDNISHLESPNIQLFHTLS